MQRKEIKQVIQTELETIGSKKETGGNREIDYEEKISRIQLVRTPRIGPITYWSLLKIYKTATEALKHVPGMAKAGGCQSYEIYDRDLAKLEFDKVYEIGGEIVFRGDKKYPKLLGTVADCPPFLSVLGNFDNTRKCVSIVGARNASLNAQSFCYKIAKELSDRGVIICSGMARGIDTRAHMGSIVGGTVAVLAGGIDVVYPLENQKLYDEIKEKGVIISESTFGTQPQAMLFPKRNRLIAAMSMATVVIEAAIKSGSLITAKAALEYGREVYAAPGFPEDPRCKGSNMLIKSGATLLESCNDVLEGISSFEIREDHDPDINYQLELISDDELSKTRNEVSSLISYTPVLVDDLIKSCNNNAQGVLIALIEMELAGKIIRLSGQRVCLRFED